MTIEKFGQIVITQREDGEPFVVMKDFHFKGPVDMDYLIEFMRRAATSIEDSRMAPPRDTFPTEDVTMDSHTGRGIWKPLPSYD